MFFLFSRPPLEVMLFFASQIRVKHFVRIKDETSEFDEQEPEQSAAEVGSVEMTGTATGADKPAIAAASSAHSHESGGLGGWISTLSQFQRRLLQFGICFAVFLLWLIIPIVWYIASN